MSLDFRTIADLRTPALSVDLSVMKRNAEKMLKRASDLGCQLRPHVKTHKTIEGAVLQTGGSKRSIVVSTLAEAFFFANAGFDDILYAVPITMDKFRDVVALTEQLNHFHILVDNIATVQSIKDLHSGTNKWSVFVMVDCGYHRDGVDPCEPSSVELVKTLNDLECVTFAGIYTHGGHSYAAATTTQVKMIAEAERDAVVHFSQKLLANAVTCPTVGVGSTPTCSIPADHLHDVTEMHPGNYLYYDTVQRDLGACETTDIAPRMLTRVIGHYPKQNMMLIDLGWTGCSTQGSQNGFGEFLNCPELRIKVLKQEAGEVESSDGSPLPFEKYPIGSMLKLLPYHSCASTQQHQVVNVLEGDVIVDTWAICKGW